MQKKKQKPVVGKRIKKKVSRTWTVRINTRVLPEQFKFVQEFAEKNKITDGEAHRALLNFCIQNADKIKIEKNAK